MFPMAAVCGNVSLMKPSERDPGATMILMELLKEAGMPPGVVNVIHGTHDCKYCINTKKTNNSTIVKGIHNPSLNTIHLNVFVYNTCHYIYYIDYFIGLLINR